MRLSASAGGFHHRKTDHIKKRDNSVKGNHVSLDARHICEVKFKIMVIKHLKRQL
jgi:hypothetical protein